MTIPVSLLSDAEQRRLEQAERINIGSYHTWNPVRASEFVIDLDAQPLTALMNDASVGCRVYEFMAIRRPGDLLHYLDVKLIDVDDEVVAILGGRLRNRADFDNRRKLPLLEADRCFGWPSGGGPAHERAWLNDDTPPHERAWLVHREAEFWARRLSELHELVRAAQVRLRQCDDCLLQNELRSIDAGRHRRDFFVDISRNPQATTNRQKAHLVPEPVISKIIELIQRDDVHSISCPFDDFALWRKLTETQVRRAEATGLPLQQAFGLCGPDSGLPDIPVDDWGGEVHIPYEGACGADLFILPSWHRFSPEKVLEGGMLRWAVSKPCHHVLLRGDYGELACATRQVIGDWTLYTSTAPYEDCNPFVDEQIG